MYSMSAAALAEKRRGRPGPRGVRASGLPPANHAHEAVVGAQLNAAGDEVVGALVGIAFLEQHAPGAQLPDLCLARKRM